MPKLIVRGNTLRYKDKEYRCAVGKGGIVLATQKREGDGCTPAGTWVLRECWYRADRLDAPITGLPLHSIQSEDGWCDDPKDERYNRHFVIPCHSRGPFSETSKGDISFEHLWREDHVYDLIVPLGYNDDPVIPGKGSAIFMHIATPDYTPTEGCVALKKEDLLEILRNVTPQSAMQIEA